MNRFFEGLAQQELAALGRRDMAIGAEHDVVGGQRIGSDEEAEIALDEAALVFAQAIRILPGRDVARHVDLLRHPVVGAGREVLLPRPLVLERHQLIDVGLAVDDSLVGGRYAARAGSALAVRMTRLRARIRGDRVGGLRHQCGQRGRRRKGRGKGRRNRQRKRRMDCTRLRQRARRETRCVRCRGTDFFFPNQHGGCSCAFELSECCVETPSTS